MGTELFHANGWAERQTDKQDKAFCNIANAANNLTHIYFAGDIVSIPEQLKHAAALFQTAVYYMGIKIFNSLPAYIKKEFTNSTKFVSLA